MISNNAKSDIDWRTLEDSPTMHKIQWIQRYRDIPFLLLLLHEYLIIVGGLYPTNYDEAMSLLVLIIWQGTMKGKLESLYFNIVWIPVESPK